MGRSGSGGGVDGEVGEGEVGGIEEGAGEHGVEWFLGRRSNGHMTSYENLGVIAKDWEQKHME